MSTHALTVNGLTIDELLAFHRAHFGAALMVDEAGDAGAGVTSGETEGEGKQEQTFSQSDVDRIVRERIQRERAKYADYDELKAKAGEKATADERIASLEREVEATKREALRRRVQAAHGIADEDAELFLTGTDEETLTAQAKRLAERESERKKNGNHVPREGQSPQPSDDPMRDFVQNLFAGTDAS